MGATIRYPQINTLVVVHLTVTVASMRLLHGSVVRLAESCVTTKYTVYCISYSAF